MMLNPRIGSEVQVWYRAQARPHMPLHGRIGTVRIVSRGPGPRNHAVEIDGEMWFVPCGNLRKVAIAQRQESRIKNRLDYSCRKWHNTDTDIGKPT